MMADGFRFVINPSADDAIGDALEDFLTDKLGPRIQANARRTVPVAEGNLKRAIILQVERDGDDSTLQVGVDPHAPGITVDEVDYGRYVELGTSRMAAQPYLRPAVYQARGATA